MIEIRQTKNYRDWFQSLRDQKAKAKINIRLRRLATGNPGDVKPVGQGVSELRIPYGPGYRVYFIQHGKTLIMLLAGGDKKTQKQDIKTALEIAKNL
jgi:putative addiction module killer protein